MIPEQVTSAYLTDEFRRRTRDSLLIFTGALLLFMVGLNSEFIGFQARFGLFAQEMFRFGPSCFPTTYQCPYSECKGIILASAEKIIELVTDRKISIKIN